MSYLKVAGINHPSATTGGLAISSGGIVTGGGLDYITSSTFTTASTVSVDGCFTATYDSYFFLLSLTGKSVDTDGSIRLRAAGADSTASTYSVNTLDSFSTSTAVATNASQSSFTNCWNAATGAGQYVVGDVIDPFAARNTMLRLESLSTNNLRTRRSAGLFANTTSFDGFSFYPSSGTITGTLAVYGYRKA